MSSVAIQNQTESQTESQTETQTQNQTETQTQTESQSQNQTETQTQTETQKSKTTKSNFKKRSNGRGRKRTPNPEYQAALISAERQLFNESIWTQNDLENAIEEKKYIIDPNTGYPFNSISWTVSTRDEDDTIEMDRWKFSRDHFFRNPRFKQSLIQFYQSRNLSFHMKPLYGRRKNNQKTRERPNKWLMTFYF